MRITRATTYIVGNPWKNWLFLRLDTDQPGLYGVNVAVHPLPPPGLALNGAAVACQNVYHSGLSRCAHRCPRRSMRSARRTRRGTSFFGACAAGAGASGTSMRSRAAGSDRRDCFSR